MQILILINIFITWIIVTPLHSANAQSPWQMYEMKIYCNLHLEKRTISMPGCKKQDVIVPSCLGLCRSYNKVLPHYPYFETRHQCCKSIGVFIRFVTLKDCNPGINRVIEVEAAAACSCQTT